MHGPSISTIKFLDVTIAHLVHYVTIQRINRRPSRSAYQQLSWLLNAE